MLMSITKSKNWLQKQSQEYISATVKPRTSDMSLVL